jgi:sulfur carrier protein
VQVTVNGVPTDVPDTTTVATLVAERSAGHSRVAVAVNGGVVPRSSWETSTLGPGDAVEVLAPTAGG